MRQFLFKWRGAILTPITLAMLLLARPTVASLMLGALLVVLGEGVRLWAIGYAGEPTRKQELDAPVLITSGPYSLVRNPLYFGNICNGMALALAACGGYRGGDLPWMFWTLPLVAVCSLAAVYGSIVALEEEFLEEQFGEEYRRYRAEVPALLPRRLKARAGVGSFCLSRALTFEKSTLMWLVLIWATLYWKTS